MLFLLQRQVRLQESRFVEEKSAKIREWVTKKVQEVSLSLHCQLLMFLLSVHLVSFLSLIVLYWYSYLSAWLMVTWVVNT